MSPFYEALRDGTAAPLLRKYGRPMIIRKETAGTVDEVGGKLTPGTPIDYPCHGVVDRYSVKEIDGTRVRIGDLKVTTTAPEGMAEATPGDHLIIDGVAHQIILPSPLAPGGVIICYEFQVRR